MILRIGRVSMNMESQIKNISVDLIIPNRFQPRLTFDEEALNDLARSIKEHGIIQPLVLRKLNDKYEIIAGERRYKAAILAGFTEVPAVITNIDDNKSAEIALVENIQRKNLNSMEEAKSYKKILDRGYLTQDDLAKKMGISQSTLSNKLRLLNLAPEVQNALMNGRISERHARSLLLVSDELRQVSLLNMVISQRLTVRQLDEIIKNENSLTSVKPTNESSELIEDNIINSNDSIGSTDLSNNTGNEVSNVSDKNLIVDAVQNDMTNIFDVGLDNYLQNSVILPNLENSTKDMATETVDTLDTLDEAEFDQAFDSSSQNDNNDSIVNDTNIVPEKSNNIFDIFKSNPFPSLEDEAVNMNVDSDNSVNLFDSTESNVEVGENDALNAASENTEIDVEKNEVIKKEEPIQLVKKGDWSSLKQAYDNLRKEVADAGFKITTEDFDFEDIYQIIIKIDKQV
jgi:ParB family chromosome partitioning protein